MNTDDIKKLRHSFTNPYRNDLPKTKVNQFGHTILGESETDLDTSEIDVKIDEFGQVRADMNGSIFDGKKMSEWAKIAVNLQDQNDDVEEDDFSSKKDVFSSLLAELDEMDSSKPKVKKQISQYKECSNKDCLYSLPKDANFCLKCGTPQLARFCIECGFNFKSEEKFCPDCGTKR